MSISLALGHTGLTVKQLNDIASSRWELHKELTAQIGRLAGVALESPNK